MIACHGVAVGKARCHRTDDLVFAIADKVDFQQGSFLSAGTNSPYTVNLRRRFKDVGSGWPWCPLFERISHFARSLRPPAKGGPCAG